MYNLQNIQETAPIILLLLVICFLLMVAIKAITKPIKYNTDLRKFTRNRHLGEPIAIIIKSGEKNNYHTTYNDESQNLLLLATLKVIDKKKNKD